MVIPPSGRPWSFRARVLVLVALAAAAVAAVGLAPRIEQSGDYHGFADRRPFAGVPNFLDVVSNAGLLAAGLLGIVVAARAPRGPFAPRGAERAGWIAFFVAIAATGFGSAWYHLAPDDARLVADRLPMAVAFMALFAALLAERVGPRTGRASLPCLAAFGAGSVLWWSGGGGLGPYVLAQYFPALAIPVVLALFPTGHRATGALIAAVAWYAASKGFEALDAPILEATGFVSGHTLKHLLAAAAVLSVRRYLLRRGARAALGEEASPENERARTNLVRARARFGAGDRI